ncbi:phosphate ABC transporter substrate-binding protein, PhoT family [Halopseudomonas litoralis]|uniref:Phosphate ABC transporter substrate-binding protein, PhoT family n=1 Tax=Halopseudomonas litoralis TaxID=797277 RepID=A0A1H1M4M4_9GAMM|nr:substrate-binding domain-containing protein [Halopseudomonas litoralis]SDR81721.1 phosphate ABC transporter substrate-binding protein, PhoT family [Halopseudomonas litoralis]
MNIASWRPVRIQKILFTGTVCLAFQAQAAALQLQINGSNTIGARLAPLLVEGMLEEAGAQNIQLQLNSETRESLITAISAKAEPIEISLNARGSTTGFTALIEQSGQIAAASRPIKDSEAEALKSRGDMRGMNAEYVIGLDGLALIVHPDNPINALDIEQIAQIFSGKITHWNQVGSEQGSIRLHARDSNSGTWETFRDLVLTPKQLKLHADARRFESNSDLSQAVSSDRNAIGFVGLASVEQAKALAVSAGDSRAMLPSKAQVATEDYPLSRRLYLYISPDENNPRAQALIAFTQSQAGQEIVEQVGFVGQNIKAMQIAPQADMPAPYQQLAEQAQRLSVNFRFTEGSSQLDNKARKDIDRVLDYLRAQGKTENKVVLVGFGDPRHGGAELISKLRAMKVRRALANQGVTVKDAFGIGADLPVAANTHDDGRVKNRRVEIWVY